MSGGPARFLPGLRRLKRSFEPLENTHGIAPGAELQALRASFTFGPEGSHLALGLVDSSVQPAVASLILLKLLLPGPEVSSHRAHIVAEGGHSHLPVPFDTGTVRAFVGVSPPDSSSDGFPVGDYSRLVSFTTLMPSADCHYALGSPCGLLTPENQET